MKHSGKLAALAVFSIVFGYTHYVYTHKINVFDQILVQVTELTRLGADTPKIHKSESTHPPQFTEQESISLLQPTITSLPDQPIINSISKPESESDRIAQLENLIELFTEEFDRLDEASEVKTGQIYELEKQLLVQTTLVNLYNERSNEYSGLIGIILSAFVGQIATLICSIPFYIKKRLDIRK